MLLTPGLWNQTSQAQSDKEVAAQECPPRPFAVGLTTYVGDQKVEFNVGGHGYLRSQADAENSSRRLNGSCP